MSAIDVLKNLFGLPKPLELPTNEELALIVDESPVPLTYKHSYGYTNAPMLNAYNVEMQLAAYAANGTLNAIVSTLANITASVNWRLYRSARSGKKEDREEVTAHPALTVWNKPNPFMPRQEFIETFQMYIDLIGETSWVVSKYGKTPYELWLPRPDRVTPTPDAKRFIKDYQYRDFEGGITKLEIDDVIQIKLPNPLDPYHGVSPLGGILADIQSSRMSAQWLNALFRNGARPNGLLKVPTALQDAEYNRMQQRWRETHQGVENTGRMAILESGVEYVDTNYTNKDMQFAELRTLIREVIREAYKFPKAALGTVDDVNRANAEANAVQLKRDLIVPRLERIKMALNADFLPLFGTSGKGYEFDYDNPVPEDQEIENSTMTAKVNAVVALVNAGATPESACSVVQLPMIEFTKRTSTTETQQEPSNVIHNYGVSEIEMANRWVAKAHLDDNTCKPCKENNGKLYRNREDAYQDYPGGAGYKDCIGAEYGNKCRCTVTKRKKGNDGNDD
jgi:HK97 family phage portal protein